MSAPVRCRPQHDDAPVVTRSLLEESNVAAAIFPERSRRSRSDTSTSRKNIKFGGVWACRSDSSTRVSEASETRDTTRRTGVSLCRPTAGRGDASDKSNSSTVGQVSRSRSDGVRLFDSCYTQALNTTLHARQRPRRVASRLWTLLEVAHLWVAAVSHSRLHVVTGLARSDFVPPHSHVHLQIGRQQDGQCGLFAAVGNRRCEWHRSYEAPAAQAATRQAQGTSNASRNCSRRNVAPLAGCPLFRVFCVRICDAHEVLRRLCSPGPSSCSSQEDPHCAVAGMDAPIAHSEWHGWMASPQ